MSNPGDFQHFPATTTAGSTSRTPGIDLDVPLLNLSNVRTRMDYVQRFLSDSVNKNKVIGEDQMEMVSSEISDAIHQIIVNGAALLSEKIGFKSVVPIPNPSGKNKKSAELSNVKFLNNFKDNGDLGMSTRKDLKVELVVDEEINQMSQIGNDWDIVELDAVLLLAEHLHFCEICGKGFKRDANLRMHMRAHGNQFKTLEALAKPEKSSDLNPRRMTRFSCPFVGCNRNQMHKKFRPLKSVICVKNHFKRGHCPKMFSCNRCHKKSFSVVADLKSHLKHCGETKWKCSCGTSFSRKDKLFGHMALFEGHMPTVVQEEDEKAKEVIVVVEDEDEDEDKVVKEMELGENNSNDNGLFEGMLDEFCSIEDFCLQDVLDSPNGGLSAGMDWLL